MLNLESLFRSNMEVRDTREITSEKIKEREKKEE